LCGLIDGLNFKKLELNWWNANFVTLKHGQHLKHASTSVQAGNHMPRTGLRVIKNVQVIHTHSLAFTLDYRKTGVTEEVLKPLFLSLRKERQVSCLKINASSQVDPY